MITIKSFDPNLLSIDKMSFKTIDGVIYHIKYITMKSIGHVNIDCENSIYLVFNNVDGYISVENNEEKISIYMISIEDLYLSLLKIDKKSSYKKNDIHHI